MAEGRSVHSVREERRSREAGPREKRSTHLRAACGRATECDETARDDDVEVPVLYPLIVLVLLHVEGLEVEPPELLGLVDASATVDDGAIPRAAVHVLEGRERRVDSY